MASKPPNTYRKGQGGDLANALKRAGIANGPPKPAKPKPPKRK